MKLDSGRIYEAETTLDELICTGRMYDLLKGSLRYGLEESFLYPTVESRSFLFTGIRGSGKRTIIDAYAGTAAEYGYTVYELPVSELIGSDPKETMQEIRSFFGSVRTKAAQDGIKIMMIFEDIWLFNDDTRAGQFFFSELGRMMKRLDAHIITVAAYDDAAVNVPQLFRGKTHVIHVDAPEDFEREMFFETNFETFVNDEVTTDYLVSRTKGFTYGELRLFTDNMLIALKGGLIGDDIEQLEQELSDDNVKEAAISKQRVEMFADDIERVRFVDDGKDAVKSIFNYPRAQIVGAVGVAAPAQGSSNEAPHDPMMDLSFNLEDIDKTDDLTEVVDPEETANRVLPRL